MKETELRRSDEALRIVPDETWERVQEVMQRQADSFERRGDGQLVTHRAGATRNRALLSGLLECGGCGAGFFAQDRRPNQVGGADSDGVPPTACSRSSAGARTPTGR